MFQNQLTIPANGPFTQMPNFEHIEELTKTTEKNDFDYKRELIKLREKLEERHQKIMQEKAALKMFNEFKENWMKAYAENPDFIPQLTNETKNTGNGQEETSNDQAFQGERNSPITPVYPQAEKFSFYSYESRNPKTTSNTTFLVKKPTENGGQPQVKGPKILTPIQTYATYPINTVPRLVPAIPDELDTTLNISRYLDHIRALQNEKEIFETVVENLMEYQKQRYGFSASSLKVSSKKESLKISSKLEPEEPYEKRKSMHNKRSINQEHEINSEYRMIPNQEEEVFDEITYRNSLVSGIQPPNDTQSIMTVTNQGSILSRNSKISNKRVKHRNSRRSPVKMDEPERDSKITNEPIKPINPTYENYNNDEGYPFETISQKPFYQSLVCNTCHGFRVPVEMKQMQEYIKPEEKIDRPKKTKHSCRGCERRLAATECKSSVYHKEDHKDLREEIIHHIHNPGSNDSLTDISRYLKYSHSVAPEKGKTTSGTFTEHDISARLRAGELEQCAESDSIVSYFIKRVNELRDQCHKFRQAKAMLHKKRV